MIFCCKIQLESFFTTFSNKSNIFFILQGNLQNTKRKQREYNETAVATNCKTSNEIMSPTD